MLPIPANPASRVAHRVYLKQMLLSERVEGRLPDWAFAGEGGCCGKPDVLPTPNGSPAKVLAGQPDEHNREAAVGGSSPRYCSKASKRRWTSSWKITISTNMS